ncbi:MAG TPA: hypothetical protein VNL71_19775 [Chloroflexota bacterium]|nr:hypothetical protein [Chloroflexota bacterium]
MSHGSVSAKDVAQRVVPQLESYLFDLDRWAREFEALAIPPVRVELPDGVMLDSPDKAKIEKIRATVAWLKALLPEGDQAPE